MTKLLWDQVGERRYETGVDQGVLYLPDGSGVSWNGLTAVEEEGEEEPEPIYLDGIKQRDLQRIADYAATLKAFTYPDEFMQFDGIESVANGLFVNDQISKTFGLSYRTRIGNDVDGTDHGYKIHIVYNLTAVPDTRVYSTMSDEAGAMEFAWSITGVPGVYPGYRPTSHIIIDTRTISSFFLSDLKDILYGSETTDPRLPSYSELVAMAEEWYYITITDNGDGTWTAEAPYGDEITMLDATTFQIEEVDAVYLDADTYEISSTYK